MAKGKNLEEHPAQGSLALTAPAPPMPKWMAERLPNALAKRHERAITLHGGITRATHPDLFLPTFGPNFRFLPNEIARSGLFTTRNRNTPREKRTKYAILVIGDGEIFYTGEELRQDDAIVWMQLLFLASLQPIGEWIEFTPRSFCKALGWGVGSKDYARLRECLTRMQACSLDLRSRRLVKAQHTPLIPFYEDKEPISGAYLPRYRVKLSTPFAELFMSNYVTKLEWRHVKDLPSGLASWLYGLICATKDPEIYGPSLERLHRLNESKASPKKFRELISRACNKLREVNLIAAWEIFEERLYVARFRAEDLPLRIREGNDIYLSRKDDS